MQVINLFVSKKGHKPRLVDEVFTYCRILMNKSGKAKQTTPNKNIEDWVLMGNGGVT